MAVHEYLKESNVHQPVTVRLDGSPHYTGIKFAVVKAGVRPTDQDYADAAIVAGVTGVMTGGRDFGTWHVWAWVTDVSPEIPKIDCGPVFRIE
jgi:hypothetical protein